jgi:hypothetical protein
VTTCDSDSEQHAAKRQFTSQAASNVASQCEGEEGSVLGELLFSAQRSLEAAPMAAILVLVQI